MTHFCLYSDASRLIGLFVTVLQSVGWVHGVGGYVVGLKVGLPQQLIFPIVESAKACIGITETTPYPQRMFLWTLYLILCPRQTTIRMALWRMQGESGFLSWNWVLQMGSVPPSLPSELYSYPLSWMWIYVSLASHKACFPGAWHWVLILPERGSSAWGAQTFLLETMTLCLCCGSQLETGAALGFSPIAGRRMGKPMSASTPATAMLVWEGKQGIWSLLVVFLLAISLYCLTLSHHRQSFTHGFIMHAHTVSACEFVGPALPEPLETQMN